MQVSFFKYYGSDYFNVESGDFIDKIQFTMVYAKDPPEIFEEWVKEDDISQYHSGEFSLSFFLGSTTTSDNGDTIEEFLEPETEPYIIICLFVIGGKTRGGVMDNEFTIKKNPPNEYEVTVKTVGMLKHVIEHIKKYNISEMSAYGQTFNQYFFNYLLGIDYIHSSWLGVYNQIDPDVKVGQTVYINTQRQMGMWTGGLDGGYSVWNAIQSFAGFMGFAMRVDYETMVGNFPRFDLIFFWLSDGGTSQTITWRENNYSYSRDYTKKYLFIRTGIIPSTDFANGFLMRMDDNYTTDKFDGMPSYAYGATAVNPIFDLTGDTIKFIRKVIVNPSYQYYEYTPPSGWDSSIPNSDVVEIDLPYHAWIQSNATYLAYAMILTLGNTTIDTDFTGINTIFEKTAGVEYQYLISGVKKVREGRIKFLPTDQTGLHDYFDCDDTTYRIDKFQTKILNREANIRAVEV